MIDDDKSVYEADSFEKTITGTCRTVHGYFYQVKLCIWYIIHLLNDGFDFQISSEWNEAGKLNDLVVRIRFSDREEMIFLQAKHQGKTTKKDSAVWFSEKDFCGYYDSYIDIEDKEKFKGTNKSFIFCTNVDITSLK